MLSQGFLGGSEPKPIKRWTPPPKDQRVPAPWEMAKTAGNKTATRRNSFGNKEKKSAPARNNPRASWVADTVNRNSMDADKDEDKHDHDQELSMDQLEIQHKEDKAAGAAKWGMSEPNFGYSADHDEEEEHMSFNNSAVFEKVEEEPELPKATRRWSKPAPPEEKLMSTTQPNVDVRNQSMDYHPSDFLGGSEPKPIKKWTPLKKEEEPAHKQTAHFSADNAHTQSIDTHPSGFLGGCEPKPIKKWTPPPKESAVPAPWEMSSGKTGGTNGRGSMKKDAHPDAFMGGCEPKPIKKWTPPKKEDSDKRLHGSVNDITWDHPTGFLGGSEPKPIKKWTPPPKESAVPAPWEISSGKAGGNNRDSVKSASDDFMGGCEPEQVKKWKPIKKEDSDRRLHGSVNDISWDHPQVRREQLSVVTNIIVGVTPLRRIMQRYLKFLILFAHLPYLPQGFLGGCDPAQPKKWTPPTKK